MTRTQGRPGGKPGRQTLHQSPEDSTDLAVVQPLGRRCDWGTPHPPDVEERARALALEATGVDYDVPPGCYLREACAELRDRCPALPGDAEGRPARRPPVQSSSAKRGGRQE